MSSNWASELAWTIPFTRSWFSSSVTTRRVWPEETQRRSAVSTFSDRSTVTTAGAGVMTWRACCSWRWKTPVSICASPTSSWPPVRDWAISTLSSSGEPPSSYSFIDRIPTSLSIQLEAVLRTWMNGLKTWVKTCSGRAIQNATRSARLIA